MRILGEGGWTASFSLHTCMHTLIIILYQSTGWPGVVAVMGNWFGKKNRGLFLGIWNAHTSIGNILGTVVPSVWAVPGQPWYVCTSIHVVSTHVRSILYSRLKHLIADVNSCLKTHTII